MILQETKKSFSIGILTVLLAGLGCNGRIGQAPDTTHAAEPVAEAGLSDVSPDQVGVLQDASAANPSEDNTLDLPEPPHPGYCPPTVAACINWCNGTPRIADNCHYGYICMNGQDPCVTKPCQQKPCKKDYVCDADGLCNWKPACSKNYGSGMTRCFADAICPSGTYVERCDWSTGVSLCECEKNGVITKKFQQAPGVHDCHIGCDIPKK